MKTPGKFHMSLRLRFITLSVVILVIVFGGLTISLIRTNTSEQRRSLEQQSEAFAALATKPIGDTFLLYKDSGKILIDKKVRELQDLNKDITNISIVDIYGQQEYGFVTDSKVDITAKQAATFKTIYLSKNGLVNTIISPYFEKNNSHRYTVIFSVSNDSIIEAINNETRTLAIAGCLALIVTVLSTYVFINRYILRPISNLSDQATIISQGNLDQQIAIEREDEIGQLSSSVNTMALSLKNNISELKELDKAKSEFMMIASHNLRTPLTIINGYLEVLNENTKPKDVMEAFQNVSSSAKKLSMFAEDILSISKMDLGDNSIHKEIFKIDSILLDIVKDYHIAANTKNITLNSTIPQIDKKVEADRSMLRLSIVNLIDNAIKFTPKGGSVNIELKYDVNKAYITISDNGIGIEENEQKRLFTKFHRGTSTLVYDYEGAGIGLYTTKKMLENMNGSIDIHSMPGSGTTATISLPIKV